MGILWVLISIGAFTLIASTNSITKGEIMIIVFITLFWFIFLSWQMHYFKVSKTFFVVKNHNLIWRNKAYRFSDIHEIVFESTKGRNCLRVITKDFRTSLYPAGTLRDKTWLALKSKLESHNIPVRNECI